MRSKPILLTLFYRVITLLFRFVAEIGSGRPNTESEEESHRSRPLHGKGVTVTELSVEDVPRTLDFEERPSLMATKGVGLEILEQAEEKPFPPTVAELEESVTWRDLGIYFLRQLLSQVQAVVPVSLYFTVFLAVVFRQPLTSVVSIVGGLVLVIIGLTFFLEGLKIFFMPLSERIGWKLPLKFPLAPVLAVLTVLGILCTYAEPALNALMPLGDLVVPYEAPYLFWIMNPWRSWLVLSIGIGVGLSILLGTLRLKRNWKLNPMIYITLILAVGPAIYLQWGNPHLKKLVALAWDIGVVATGPVTVPITLALGSGIAMGSPSLAKNPLSGFGLVALASLYPIITVQTLIMILSFLKSRDDLLIEIEILLNSNTATAVSVWDKSPLLELILSLRSILPLAGLLLAILLLAVRESLPELSWYQILKADRESREDSTERKERQKKEDEESHPSNLKLDEFASREDHESDDNLGSQINSDFHVGSSHSRHEINLNQHNHHSHHHYSDSIVKSGSFKRSGMLKKSTSNLNRSGAFSKSSTPLKRAPSGLKILRTQDQDDSDEEGDHVRRGRSRVDGIERSQISRHEREDDEGYDSKSDDNEDGYSGSPPPRSRGRLTDDEDDLESGEKERSSGGFFDSWRISIDGTRQHLEQHYNAHGHGGSAHGEESDKENESDEMEGRDSVDYPSRESMDREGSYEDSDLDSRRMSMDSEYEEEEIENSQRVLENFDAMPVNMTKFQQLRAKASTLIRRHSVFLLGLLSVQIGCLLFNWGIVYGLSPLSLQVGGWLPTAYMHVNGVADSPKYEYAIGVLLILVFGFLLGALVTLAEPGMAVFCRQVTSVTNGEIETNFLLATVSVGVGSGLSIGMLTLVFHVPTLYIVLAGYPIAVLFTMLTPNPGLSAVAWDAAGTVTGPVTTPLVLAIGLAFGLRDPLVDGFGVLTCAAIFPIISILLTKKIVDVFSGLKERARMAPVKPGQMGVLSATLRWGEDEAEKKKRRRARRKKKRRMRRRRERLALLEAQELQERQARREERRMSRFFARQNGEDVETEDDDSDVEIQGEINEIGVKNNEFGLNLQAEDSLHQNLDANEAASTENGVVASSRVSRTFSPRISLSGNRPNTGEETEKEKLRREIAEGVHDEDDEEDDEEEDEDDDEHHEDEEDDEEDDDDDYIPPRQIQSIAAPNSS